MKTWQAPLLSVQGLSYAYAGQPPAVAGVSFEVAAGELVALVGRNGAGKSTLLRCLAGWSAPAAGHVRILGLGSREHERELRRYVTLVPDTPSFYDELTAWEHVQLVAQAHRLQGWQEKARALLERLDLWPGRGAYPFTFSRGMRYKLALCLALTVQPRLLLLDEPLGPLDPLSAEMLWRLLMEQRAAGAGIVLSSHQLPPQAEPDRYLILERGALIAQGAAAELAQGAPGRPSLEVLLRAALEAHEAEAGDG
ncbi:MAG TPA: ABC transporter ATP-binding protein [Anaerolineae bacterium]|nr:ABC transporter ATP-binding protein [Anaerolineae bacterium]HOQ98164.1 ABC transporter ATP-binding protein [Anaerolineae bacterium]HPL27778.1 ABC transporter ATP-binding protein [Anaerolineae bacterium]